MKLDTSKVRSLRKNASATAVATAVRADSRRWWDIYHVWHIRWTNNEGDFRENIDKKDEASHHASYLGAIADHLDRLAK